MNQPLSGQVCYACPQTRYSLFEFCQKHRIDLYFRPISANVIYLEYASGVKVLILNAAGSPAELVKAAYDVFGLELPSVSHQYTQVYSTN